MIGEQWNTLVAPPSDRELDAAMASVRVRALDHWKRRVWRGRALLGAAFMAVATLAAYGGSTLRPGLSLTPDWRQSLAAAGVSHRPSVQAGDTRTPAPPTLLRRFHITSTTDVDGVTMNEGEAWVEGPDGLAFAARFHFGDQSYQGNVVIDVLGDSMAVAIDGKLERGLGYTERGGAVTEVFNHFGPLTVPVGQAIVFYPFGSARAPDGSRTVVRIEGPWAPPPATPITWRTAAADTARIGSWAGPRNDRGLRAAARRGVRYAVRNIGAVDVSPHWVTPPMRIRVARGDGPWTDWIKLRRYQRTEQVVSPGVTALLRPLPADESLAVDGCVQLLVQVPRRPGARQDGSRPWNAACFAPGVRHASFDIARFGRFRIERELPAGN